MIDATVGFAVISSALIFTALGFLWGLHSGIEHTVKVLADLGYVKHTWSATGELKLRKLNED